MKNLNGNLLLKYLGGYRNPRRYWNTRWRLGYDPAIFRFYNNINKLMKQYSCQSLIDVGCGLSKGSGVIKDYTGLDFSKNVLEKNPRNTIQADITEPLLVHENWDCVCTRAVLLHIPPEKIEVAVYNIKQMAEKAIFLANEYQVVEKDKFHCYKHDLRELFT